MSPSLWNCGGYPARLSILAAAFLWLAGVAPVLAQNALVIDGARIVSGSGPVIEKGRVVIVGDKVAALGPDAPIPSDAAIIDGKGLTVYPGLIDAFCLAGVAPPPAAPPAPQPRNDPPAQTAQQRAAQARQRARSAPQPAPLVWRKATDGFTSTSEALAALRANGYIAALFGVRGVLTPGEGVLMSLAPGEPTTSVLRDRAAVNLNMQSRGGGAYPSTLMGAFAYLRQSLYDALDARNRPVGPPNARLDALGLAAAGEIPTLITANSVNDIDRALRIGQEFKLRTVILGGRDAGRSATKLAESKAAVILTEDWSQASALAKAGVPFALGSNRIEMSASEADELRQKAVDLVEKGVPEETVLSALTRIPAEILGVADRLGSVGVGKPAHLVVSEGSLFQKGSKVKFVVIGGKKIDATPVRSASAVKPKPLLEDGVPYPTVTEDDADGHRHGDDE